jgi:hypothetical protein
MVDSRSDSEDADTGEVSGTDEFEISKERSERYMADDDDLVITRAEDVPPPPVQQPVDRGE